MDTHTHTYIYIYILLPKGKNTKLEMQHTNIVCKDVVHIISKWNERIVSACFITIGNIKAK